MLRMPHPEERTMTEDDLRYLQQRAATEAARANEAGSPEVADTHQQFARAYRERIASATLPPSTIDA